MKFTNKAGLPSPLFNALSDDSYQKIGDYSVTELMNPPQITHLQKRHKDEVVRDVMDNMWSMFGTAMHEVAAKGATSHSIIEEGFLMPILMPTGKTITVGFHPDHVWKDPEDENYQMIDFKNVSYWSVKYGLKPEWNKQLNLYRYGMGLKGFKIDKLWLAALLRDWSYNDCHVKKIRDYPPFPIMNYPIEIWSDEWCLEYLIERITLHEEAKACRDSKLPQCSAEDRWERGAGYAVVFKAGLSKGNAVRGGTKFDTRPEAIAFHDLRTKTRSEKTKPLAEDSEVVYRSGEAIRCERYCDAKNFCHQYAAANGTKINPF